jgi:hypothetical protein
MRYFFHVHVEARQNEEISFFVLSQITAIADGKIKSLTQELTAEKVKQNPAYAELAKKKYKRVMVDYIIFQTETEITQTDDLNTRLQAILDDGEATRLACGELEICSSKNAGSDRKSGSGKKKNKKLNSKSYLVIGTLLIVALFCGIAVGQQISGTQIVTPQRPPIVHSEFEEFIMPVIPEFPPEAELVTITIDRSYFAVPREDLQLQGVIINGIATITLPAFDRNDFFTHVPGHGGCLVGNMF